MSIVCAQSNLELTFSNWIGTQHNNPLLWIIDTAPLFLGIFAYVIGLQLDRLNKKNEMLVETQTLLLARERLATIGQLTAGISHELKNPLNFVNNFAESSEELLEDLSELLRNQKAKIGFENYQHMLNILRDLQENSRDILTNGKRANDIIYSIMNSTRQTKDQKVLSDLNQIIAENVHLAHLSYRASHPSFHVDIHQLLQPNLPHVLCDPQSIGRVVLNIVNNALFALNKKQLKDQYSTPILSIKTLSTESAVLITIRDNGNGISKNLQSKIFDPFFTTKPIGEGNTGLGLSIAHDIVVKEHQGKLDVVSKVSEFTEFRITLPLGLRNPKNEVKNPELVSNEF